MFADICLAQQLVDGPEDECERSSELMADAGEERRLRLIEFGQGLGTLLLRLVAACTSDTRGDVTGHEFDKAAIAVVEPAMPVQPNHQQTEWGAGLLQNRHDKRLGGRLAPSAGRQIQCEIVELDQLGFTLDGFSDGPYRRAIALKNLRCPRVPGSDPTRPGQPSVAVITEQVDEGEWQVVRVIAKAGWRRSPASAVRCAPRLGRNPAHAASPSAVQRLPARCPR